MQLLCLGCKLPFTLLPWELQRLHAGGGVPRYCSQACAAQAQEA